ncbi:MAG: Ig-like domain-containing protein [Dysgonamonadaceae bacterium]|nr:Ig-like domain-containing protein [Dysgonamonadaceae bacterium]MDD4727427.1 Ig-like domain-containing protein [Dysgonamonadaceae bacterium]
MKNKPFFFVLLISLILCFGCDKEESIKSISLNETTLSLEVGETHSLKVSVSPANIDIPPFIWKTSDKEIVSVNDKGEIRALSLGEVTITVYEVENNLESSCKVTVKPTIATGITLDVENLNLIIDEEYTLKHEILPEETTNKEVAWSSDDTDIATVDNEGKVKAIGVGETTITIYNHDKTLKAHCIVNVNPIKATGITLKTKELDLFIGDDVVLEYEITPDNTTNKEVVWSSKDENIATVNSEGKIQAISAGTTIVTVKIDDDIFDSCEVKVNNVEATGISLNETSLTIEMTDKYSLSVNFSPENTTNKSIIWSTSDSNVAIVSEKGEVTGIKEGEAIITAESKNGNFTASCVVTVKLNGIMLSSNSISLLPGIEKVIWVNYLNDEAYLYASWSSSNTNVATVERDNEQDVNSAAINTINPGTSIITATSKDGSKEATCYIEVKDITDFINLDIRRGGITIINGFVTGDVYSEITNNSPESIELTEFHLFDGYSGKLVAYTTNPDQLGTLHSYEKTNLGSKLNSVYLPIFRWRFKWNGVDYEVQHQFKQSSPWNSAKATNMKLNLLENE